MFCDRCGTRLHDGQNFCPTCGKTAGIVPLMPVRSRLAGHVRLLGILWLALSAFRLLPGLFLMALFRHRGPLDFLPPEVPFFVHTVGAAACEVGGGVPADCQGSVGGLETRVPQVGLRVQALRAAGASGGVAPAGLIAVRCSGRPMV
jgi:hypothetical protein